MLEDVCISLIYTSWGKEAEGKKERQVIGRGVIIYLAKIRKKNQVEISGYLNN
jgi:hypothetical protein